MGATEYCYTDRNAWTVVWVSPNKKTIILTRDSYKRIDSNGMSESQEYEFTSDMNPENGRKATLRKNGQWRWQGDSIKNGNGIVLGHRDRYYDFSF
jgi:hypothetical protein